MTEPSFASADEKLRLVLSEFLTAPKRVPTAIVWTLYDSRSMRFQTSLDIDGVTQQSLVLFGRASPRLPDRDVTLGLRWNDMELRGGRFERLDWRPVHSHNNGGVGPAELRFWDMVGSHHHPLQENAALAMGLINAMTENLPVALPLKLPDPDWHDFLAEAALRWKIEQLAQIPQPGWQEDLLDFGEARQGRRRS